MKPIEYTRGDTRAIRMRLKANGAKFDATGGTFVLKVYGKSSSANFNSQGKFAIDPDGSGDNDLVAYTPDASDSATLPIGNYLDLKLQVTQGAAVTTFPARGAISVSDF